MSNFLEGLVREGKRSDLHDGLKAFVWLYYSNFTDATEVEPDALRLMDSLLSYTYLMADVEEIVTEAEDEINEAGGVRSETTGKKHPVCTYKEGDRGPSD